MCGTAACGTRPITSNELQIRPSCLPCLCDACVVDQPTRAELRLWSKLRRREPFWWREVQSDVWTFDFFCPHARLAVEVDGGYHSQSYFAARDRHRDDDNARYGVLTLRFTNHDVLWRRRRVLREVDAVVEARTGAMVRSGWSITHRAAEMRESYEPRDEMRPVRRPQMRYEQPLQRTGPGPAKLLAEKVRSPTWASQRQADHPARATETD
jgi:very-short-patch-repair endonuclease